MLSIVIPTYNYNTILLVEELYYQCKYQNIDFEIIVADDFSNNAEIKAVNEKINNIENCTYYRNLENLGRGQNINAMVLKAKYQWVLLLDCDVFPKEKNFIKNYIRSIDNSKFLVAYGGIKYKSNKPNDLEMLRWVYGRKREALALQKRELQPYLSCLTSNILVKKEIFVQFPFHNQLKTYGFEDLVFALTLRNNGIKINHLDNEVYHLNLEKSISYIIKVESSLKNLKFLVDSKIINHKDARFSSLYYKLNWLKITELLSVGFKIFKPLFIKNLTSKNPSIFVFDLYRLGFYCTLK